MRVFLLAVLSLFATSAFADHECRYSAERKMDIDPAGLKTLALALSSSDLHATGVDGISKIEVRGKACASDESWLANLDLQQERAGDKVTVSPKPRDGKNIYSMMGSTYAYIDIEVRMPKNLPLEINSASGDAKIADVAAVTFDTSSGDMQVDRVAGAVDVKLGSGDVVADTVGSLTIDRTGSGDVQASHVRGAVKVGHVGSGDLTFKDVQNGVDVESIGSGDLVVDRAGGDVTVGSVGSGDVTVDDITGAFTVGHAGSGDIHHHNVTGKVAIPKHHEND
jgi:Putative adhesin